jgi:PAS domain S-box-containing protein
MIVQSSLEAASELFTGDAETSVRMRAIDWSKTPLGPVETWPQSLKTCVGICVHSRFAICIYWGPELVMLYNDAYISVAGGKHPQALGTPACDVWPEIWDTIGPLLHGVLQSGEATWADDLLLPMERNGYAEECYFTFSYGPIRDESGGVGGIFTPVLETTERVIEQRRIETLRRLAAISGIQSETMSQACLGVADVLAGNVYDLPFAAIYMFDPEPGERSHRATLCASCSPASDPIAFPEHVDLNEGNWSCFRQVARGETCAFDLAVNPLFALSNAPWGARPVEAIALPILLREDANPLGFLLAGVNARKRLDEAYLEFYAQIGIEMNSAVREIEVLERERTLREQADLERKKIHDLLFHAPAAIATLVGPEHRFTLLNHAYEQLISQKSEDVIGKAVIEVFPELRGQGVIEILDEVYRTGVPFVGNEKLMKLDIAGSGELSDVFFNFVYQSTRDANNEIDGVFVLAIDVTQSVLARREIETREEQFRVLADTIPQMVWVAGADGALTWYNRRWYEYTGTTFEQMEGWGWTALPHPDYLPKVVEGWEQAVKTGKPFSMTYPLRGADGVFHSFLTLAHPLRDGEGNIVRWFGTNTDIEAQQKSDAALRHSERLAVVGRLASSIAHEINNPLEAVTNLVYLARSVTGREDVAGYLEAAGHELERMAEITNQTLRFHKQQSAAAPTDMAKVVESVLTLYRGKVSREGIELRLETKPSPSLLCYAGEIRQLLANLIGNALDAMPKGGVLRLQLRPSTDWRSGKPGVRITVADTGSGMSAETRKRVYEPFYTTKGDVGTGLGLWVSAGIVEKHGGSMHVRSRVGMGTAFTVILPEDGCR